MEEEMALMTQEDVSNYFHCSTHHVTHMRQSGLIKGVKFGKRWLYRKSDIEAFVEESLGIDFSNFRNLSPEGIKNKYNI